MVVKEKGLFGPLPAQKVAGFGRTLVSVVDLVGLPGCSSVIFNERGVFLTRPGDPRLVTIGRRTADNLYSFDDVNILDDFTRSADAPRIMNQDASMAWGCASARSKAPQEHESKFCGTGEGLSVTGPSEPSRSGHVPATNTPLQPGWDSASASRTLWPSATAPKAPAPLALQCRKARTQVAAQSKGTRRVGGADSRASVRPR